MTTTDRPMAMAAPSSRFWDRIAAKYARQPVADEAAYQTKLHVTRGYLRPDWEVMEFGCGTGSTALAHAPHVRHILATDISEPMLEIARGKAAEAGTTNVTFERAAIENWPAPEACYDAVLGLSILHLLRDPEAAIAKVHHALKPGGIFVSSTACLADHMPYLAIVLPIGRLAGVFPFVRVFSERYLLGAMTRAGFRIEQHWRPGRGKAVFLIARKT